MYHFKLCTEVARTRIGQPLIKNTIHSRAVSNTITLLWYTITTDSKNNTLEFQQKGVPNRIEKGTFFGPGMVEFFQCIDGLTIGPKKVFNFEKNSKLNR